MHAACTGPERMCEEGGYMGTGMRRKRRKEEQEGGLQDGGKGQSREGDDDRVRAGLLPGLGLSVVPAAAPQVGAATDPAFPPLKTPGKSVCVMHSNSAATVQQQHSTTQRNNTRTLRQCQQRTAGEGQQQTDAQNLSQP